MRLKVNPLGFAAAALMMFLALEREPPWWRLSLGEGLLSFNASPFKMSLTVLGQEVLPPIVEYLTLGAWLVVVVGAVLMIVGSLSTRAWSKSLMSFGLSKLAWEVGGVVAAGVLVYLIAGPYLGALPIPMGGVEVVEHTMPLLAGEGVVKLKMAQEAGQVLVTIPVASTLTNRFYLAIAALAACVAARLYQGRLVEA